MYICVIHNICMYIRIICTYVRINVFSKTKPAGTNCIISPWSLQLVVSTTYKHIIEAHTCVYKDITMYVRMYNEISLIQHFI